MQEVEEKRALPKTLDYCLFIAMSLLSFHFSRGTNGKGSWFIVWLKMHWKESNFPLKTVKTQRTKVLLEWGKAESHYCHLSIWNMGYATVKAGKERPLQKMYNGWAPGPGSARSWHCWIGWAERAQLQGGGPCPSLSSQRHFPWIVSQGGPTEGSLVPHFSENEFTHGISS